jgi:hypothetical protein
MSEEKTPEVKQPESTIDESKVQELIAKALAEQAEKYKSEISGLNRRVSEIDKEKQELAKAKMSDVEKLDFERKEAEKARKLAEDYRLNLVKLDALAKEGLPTDYADYIHSPDEMTMREKIKALKALREKEIAEARKQWELQTIPNQKPPKTGGDVALTKEQLYALSEEEIKKIPQERLKQILGAG